VTDIKKIALSMEGLFTSVAFSLSAMKSLLPVKKSTRNGNGHRSTALNTAAQDLKQPPSADYQSSLQS